MRRKIILLALTPCPAETSDATSLLGRFSCRKWPLAFLGCTATIIARAMITPRFALACEAGSTSASRAGKQFFGNLIVAFSRQPSAISKQAVATSERSSCAVGNRHALSPQRGTKSVTAHKMEQNGASFCQQRFSLSSANPG